MREGEREVNEKFRGRRSRGSTRGCLPFITAGYPLMESSCLHLSTVLPTAPRCAAVISVLRTRSRLYTQQSETSAVIQKQHRYDYSMLSQARIYPILS